MKFICDKSNPIYAEWLKQYEIVNQEMKTEKEFLVKRAEALEARRNEIWDRLWSATKEAGIVDSKLSRETHCLSLSSDMDQLFVDEIPKNPFADLIRAMGGRN